MDYLDCKREHYPSQRCKHSREVSVGFFWKANSDTEITAFVIKHTGIGLQDQCSLITEEAVRF